jgi:hypothetical protein
LRSRSAREGSRYVHFPAPALGLTPNPREKAYAMALFTRYLDMSAEEVAVLCRLAQADVSSKKVHAYQIMYVRSPIASRVLDNG